MIPYFNLNLKALMQSLSFPYERNVFLFFSFSNTNRKLLPMYSMLRNVALRTTAYRKLTFHSPRPLVKIRGHWPVHPNAQNLFLFSEHLNKKLNVRCDTYIVTVLNSLTFHRSLNPAVVLMTSRSLRSTCLT